MGGVDDHRPPQRHRLLQAPQQQRADLIPGPLDTGIAEQFGTDGIGGEHLARFNGVALEQRRQVAGEGGLAAARRADQ